MVRVKSTGHVSWWVNHFRSVSENRWDMRVSSGRTVGEVVLEDNQNTGSTQIANNWQEIYYNECWGKYSIYTFRKSREKGQKCKKKKNRKRQRKKQFNYLARERERCVCKSSSSRWFSDTSDQLMQLSALSLYILEISKAH